MEQRLVNFKRGQDFPGVGHYEVEKSRNLLEHANPQWSMLVSRKVLFTEDQTKYQQHFPDINKYNSSKCYKSISQPYLQRDISLPIGPKRFKDY